MKTEFARRSESVTPERLNIDRLKEDFTCMGAARMSGETPSWLESQAPDSVAVQCVEHSGN
jgi:hypothetical protein